MDIREVVFIAAILLLSLYIYFAQFKLQTIINVTGAFFLATGNIIMPIVIHLKCVLKDRSSGFIEGD